jgi:putative lysine transport system permease protein
MNNNIFGDIARLWQEAAPQYLRGAGNTLLLAVVATAAGCIIGLLCGILQTLSYSKNDLAIKKVLINFIKAVVRVYVEVFRGTPMILQAVFIYYGVPYFFGHVFRSIWAVSLIVVSINTGAYMAESVRGGILSIDPGQTEGAKAIGMNHFQTMLYVILPQALRNIMPQIGNNYIINVKDTSVMFIIGFSDFFSIHKMVSGAIYKYFPSAFIEMVGYLTLTLVASFLLRWVEKKLAGSESYELAAGDQLVTVAGTYNSPAKGSPFDEKSKEFGKELYEPGEEAKP